MLRVRQRNSRLVSRLVESKCPIGQIPNCEEKKNLWNSKKAARFGLNRTARGRSGPRRARAGLEPLLSKSGVDSGSGGTNNQSKETSTMNKESHPDPTGIRERRRPVVVVLRNGLLETGPRDQLQHLSRNASYRGSTGVKRALSKLRSKVSLAACTRSRREEARRQGQSLGLTPRRLRGRASPVQSAPGHRNTSRAQFQTRYRARRPTPVRPHGRPVRSP